MFVDCIHVVFCRPLALVTGFNAICNACLAGVPSGRLKMCPVNLTLFYLFMGNNGLHESSFLYLIRKLCVSMHTKLNNLC